MSSSIVCLQPLHFLVEEFFSALNNIHHELNLKHIICKISLSECVRTVCFLYFLGVWRFLMLTF